MPDGRIPASLPRRTLDRTRGVPRALSRPADMVEGTRWLFWLLAMISLALSAPAVLAGERGLFYLGLAGAVALAGSLTLGYLTQRVHWGWDLVESASLLAMACAAVAPSVVFALLFAMIWYRSLYGSTGGALLRCVLYGATILTCGLVLSPQLPGDVPVVEVPMVLSSIPTMFVTVVAARHLAGIIRDRQLAAQRDAIHAAAGSRLLGVTDRAEITRLSWDAIGGICASTPGLRVLGAVEQDEGLHVFAHAGEFRHVPTTVSAVGRATLDAYDDHGPAHLGFTELDDAVGSLCEWRCLTHVEAGAKSWLVLASPGRIPTQAVDTLTSLANQAVLALRNSVAHQELTEQATLDGLTGLANRKLFNLTLAETLRDAAGTSTETAVMFVDLDDFKDVNDVFGHGAGDDLLREVAARITGATRLGDLVSRLGGDEFAVLLPHTGAEEATDVGRRIVEAVAEPMRLAAGAARVGASVGLAVDLGDTTPEQLVQHADIAMYAAKAGGKGRMQVFAAGLLQGDAAQQSFDRQLLAATENHELVVAYQPVLSVTDGRCVAVEALVRWEHPDRGLLSPGEFIADAERTGAILDIGGFVLRRACADVSAWRASRHAAPLAVHVNVSALQLDTDDFHALVLDVLAECAMSPDELVLEVTETMVISSPAAVAQLNRLAEHGVQVAIDDFGTGYSSLTTLRALPISVVKIDQSFIAGSTVNAEDRAVTEAVVQMAARMGLRTIAEGVERPDQQAFLESIGADAAQGFLYLRPALAPELGVWLDDNLAQTRTPTGTAAGADGVDHGVLPFTPRTGALRR